MKINIPILAISFAMYLTSCGVNETKNPDTQKDNAEQINRAGQQDKINKTRDFLQVADLIKIISLDNLDKKTISEYLKPINKNWKAEGSDNEEIYFLKNKDEATKEMLTYHYKNYVLEYLTFSKNHFFEITKDIKEQDFEIAKTSKNEFGGQITTFSSKKLLIVTEEIPLTEPGQNGFKIFVAQKR